MKIKLVVWLILVITFIAPISAFPSESEDPVFDKANKAYDKRDFSQAIELYQKVIERDPGNLSAIFWAANAAQIIEDYEKEIGFLKKLKTVDPKGIKPREGLIVAPEFKL